MSTQYRPHLLHGELRPIPGMVVGVGDAAQREGPFEGAFRERLDQGAYGTGGLMNVISLVRIDEIPRDVKQHRLGLSIALQCHEPLRGVLYAQRVYAPRRIVFVEHPVGYGSAVCSRHVSV